MRENNLFSDKLFGFITGRSTLLQMLTVLDIWTEILDQGGELDVIYCDFMKAFDTVPNKRLVTPPNHHHQIYIYMFSLKLSSPLIFLFADDTKVFRKIERENDQIQQQKVPQRMYNLSAKWFLKFHPEKYASMSKGNKATTRKCHMDGHPLSNSDCEKDLGIHIDQDLTFIKHITWLSIKLIG